MMGGVSALPLEDDPSAGYLAARVEQTRERLTLTRDGEPVAVVISASELEGLEDTLELLRDPDESAAVDEGITDLAAGRVHDEAEVRAALRNRAGS